MSNAPLNNDSNSSLISCQVVQEGPWNCDTSNRQTIPTDTKFTINFSMKSYFVIIQCQPDVFPCTFSKERIYVRCCWLLIIWKFSAKCFEVKIMLDIELVHQHFICNSMLDLELIICNICTYITKYTRRFMIRISLRLGRFFTRFLIWQIDHMLFLHLVSLSEWCQFGVVSNINQLNFSMPQSFSGYNSSFLGSLV